MEKLVAIKNGSVTHMIPKVSKFNDDNSFETTSHERFIASKNKDVYTFEYTDFTQLKRLVKPKMGYDVFERTTDFNNCDLLSLSYYNGQDYKKVTRGLDKKTFIIDDKLPLNHNCILEYIGLEHIDDTTKIELTNECSYTMYKKVKAVKI